MITWNQAFDQVLREFDVQAKWLSQVSGVSEYTISQFRKSRKDATTGTLRRLLAPLPEEAREKFFSLLLGASLSPASLPTFEEQLEKLSKEQIEELSKESKKKLVMAIFDSLDYESSTSRLEAELVKPTG
jgi:hypothetical protein